MKIAFGCDPNAADMKLALMDFVRSLGHEVFDFGSDDPIYANVAFQVAQAVADKKVVKSAGNIPGVQTTVATTMNVYDTINAKTLVVDLAAAKKLEEVFA